MLGGPKAASARSDLRIVLEASIVLRSPEEGEMADGRAVKKASTFRMECGVVVSIRASPRRIWGLLTDSAGFPRWNSTVTSIEGQISLGQKLAVRVPLAPGRVFKPKVVEFEPERRMVWADGQAPMFAGRRTYELKALEGFVEFSMVEVFSGVMLPLIKGSLPDFGPAFEQYAADLKREAERPS
jgi:hypothetical protein